MTSLFPRYLSPDTTVLLDELRQVTDKKHHRLNKALCGLVSQQRGVRGEGGREREQISGRERVSGDL